MERSLNLSEGKLWIGTWDGGWGLLPPVAVVGGVWAFAGPPQGEQLVTLGAALALVLAGWLPLWRALVATDWATPLALWRTWEREEPLPRWPYLQAGTPGAALHRTLGQMRAWWRDAGCAMLALPLRSALLALVISLLIAFVLGRFALILTLCLLTWAELAALWHEGRGEAGPLWVALGTVGLPWLLGATLWDGGLLLPTLSALTLTLLAGLYAHASLVSLGGPLIGALFLIWQGHPFAAGILLLLGFPGFQLLLHRPEADVYRRAAAPWLLAMLLLVAGVL